MAYTARPQQVLKKEVKNNNIYIFKEIQKIVLKQMET